MKPKRCFSKILSLCSILHLTCELKLRSSHLMSHGEILVSSASLGGCFRTRCFLTNAWLLLDFVSRVQSRPEGGSFAVTILDVDPPCTNSRLSNLSQATRRREVDELIAVRMQP